MNISVEKIVFRFQGTDRLIELSDAEARALHKKLEELFGAEQQRYVPMPYPVYPAVAPIEIAPWWEGPTYRDSTGQFPNRETFASLS